MTTQKKDENEQSVDVDRLLGIAVGCIGMSYVDFCRCTPSQFNEIYLAWQQAQQRTERLSWESARFIATCVLQPHSKKKLKSTDVALFSWEKQIGDEPVQKGTREDFEKAVAKYGG